MNELIEAIFEGFAVGGKTIPVAFLFYEGHGEDYVVYSQMDADNSLSGDDELIGYVDYYDFDVYCHKDGPLKGNYTKIIERIKPILKENNFVWQPSRSSEDMYETETGYYHKTLNFAIMREE